MKPDIVWVVVGIVVIAIVLSMGILPLPGQGDAPTPYSQPAAPGTSPQPTPPTGPPHDVEPLAPTPRN